MEYITTTNLRTQSSKLIDALKKGGEVSLIYRSKIIGVIKSKKEAKVLTRKEVNELKNLAQELNLPKTLYAQRDQIYRKHLMKEYGKNLS